MFPQKSNFQYDDLVKDAIAKGFEEAATREFDEMQQRLSRKKDEIVAAASIKLMRHVHMEFGADRLIIEVDMKEVKKPL